jgi:hypothetical protein
MLRALGERIVEGCAQKLGEEEMQPLRRRWAALQNVTGASGPD